MRIGTMGRARRRGWLAAGSAPSSPRRPGATTGVAARERSRTRPPGPRRRWMRSGGVVSQQPASRSRNKHRVGVAPILRAVGLSALLLGGYLLLLRF